MDGVIIDSEPLWRKAEIECFGKIGVILNDEMCRSTAGLKLTQVVAHWKNKFGFTHALALEVEKKVSSKIIAFIHESGKPFDGLNDLITTIQNKNLRIALASGSSYEIINAVLHKFNLKNKFSVIRSGQDEKFGKPDPAIFLNTAKLLQVDPLQCLVIEDSANGVKAAINANMKVVAMPEVGFEKNDIFNHANYRVNHLNEIIPIIESVIK